MPAPTTIHDFLDVCRKSGVIEEESLTTITGPAASSPVAAAKALIRTGALTKFQAAQLLAGKYKGLRFDRLKILDRIGSGGMGTVFLCEHTGLRKQVAVKVLPPDQAGDEGTRERFFREARAAAALDHPNIVRVHDMNSSGGVHYIVMEYVDGQDLQTLVNKYGAMPHTRACTYIAQAALGLQHAFEKGLVHRDIKPANLLVDKEGVVKILDMGLARFNEDDKDNLTAKYDKGAVLGTADYMAPEQVTASSEVDIRADVYSLGVTLYALINGKPPFGGTSTQKLMGHQAVKATSLTEVRREVPKSLSAVVARMMAKDPNDRFQTPAEVVEALTPWLEADTIPLDMQQTRKMSGSGLTRRRLMPAAGKSRMPLIVGAVAVSAVVFGGVGVWALTGNSKPSNQAAAQNTEVPPPNTPASDLPRGPIAVVATPPTDARLVYEMDFSKQSHFGSHFQRKAAVGHVGRFPDGWAGQVWGAQDAGAVEMRELNGSRGVALQTTYGEGSAELHTNTGGSPFKLIPRQRYLMWVEYANVGTVPGAIEVRFDNERAPGRFVGALPPGRGEWRAGDLRFTAPEHSSVATYLTHRGATSPNYLIVRSFKVFEIPADESTATYKRVVYESDFSKQPAFKGTMAKPGGLTMQEGRLPTGWNAFVWKNGAAGEVAREEFAGKAGIAFRTTSGDASAEITTHTGRPPEATVRAGGRYRVEVEYAAPGNNGGRLDVRFDDLAKPGSDQLRLPRTGTEWRTAGVEFTVPAGQDRGFYTFISNFGAGRENTLYVRSVTLSELVERPAGTVVYRLDLGGQGDGKVRVMGGHKDGGGQLPNGFAVFTWDKDSTVEAAVETFEGSRAITLRTVSGKNAAMLFGPQLPLVADHQYQVNIEYQLRGTTAGQLKVDDTQVRGRVIRELRTTGRAWATATVTFRTGVSVDPGKLEFGHGGTDVMAVRRIEVTDLGPFAPPKQIVYQPDFASLAPTRIKLKGKEVLESSGQVPDGFTTYAWNANSVMEFGIEQSGDTRLMVMRSLENAATGMVFLPDVVARKGTTYWIRIDYQCNTDAAGKVRIVADPGKVRDIGELIGTRGQWRTTHIPFRLTDEEGERVRIELHNWSRESENPLMFRSIVVAEEEPLTAPVASIGPPLYRFTAADATPFKTTLSQRRHVTQAQVPGIPPGHVAGIWRQDDTGEVGVEDIAGKRALTLTNADGGVSIQFFPTESFGAVQAGQEYTLRVVHWANSQAQGRVEVRKAKVQGVHRIHTHQLKGTNGQWVETTVKFTPAEDASATLYVQNGAGGEDAKLAIHSIELFAPGGAAPAATGVGSSYQLNLSTTRAFARRYKKDAVVESQGDGSLPSPWVAGTAGDETLGDVFAEVLGGQMAIGLRNHQGPPSIQLFNHLDLVRVTAGKKYSVKLTYQTEANGKGWFKVLVNGTEANKTDFSPAVGNWKDAAVTVTADADGALRLVVGCDSSGSEASVYVRGIEVREVP
ncbi:MAG TPA: serine/threonine-protein kinase [Gemmataceae bacterium]|nr:serine/threonine-protein kinase [Gemmataceae bacterium]